VDNPPVINVVKAGSGIPVKFSLGGNQGLKIFDKNYPLSQPMTCISSAPTDPIESTVNAGKSSLSYDILTGQYIYVWKTEKSWSGTCRQLTVQLIDGTEHIAYFSFK